MSRRVSHLLHRLGKEVDVLTRFSDGTNAFNNPDSTWEKTGTSVCVRTYPNRNTQVNRGGTFERDHPVFLFSRGDEPPSDARIVYEGVTYGLESPTKYDTHVAFFGNRV